MKPKRVLDEFALLKSLRWARTIWGVPQHLRIEDFV